MGRTKFATLVTGIILVLVLASTAFLAACGPSAPAPTGPQTLLIGNLEQMTGWFSAHDVQDASETQLMADYINEKGGIVVGGQQYNVKIVVEDGKSTFEGVAAAANKLVFDHKVKFIIGPNAFFSIASNPITNANKVLIVSGFNTMQPGELDKSTPYTFTGYNGVIGQSIATIKYFRQAWPDVKNVAFITPDDGMIDYGGELIWKTMAENGFTRVGDPILYANETTDFNPIATKVNAMNIDGILHINGIAPHIGAMLKGMREAGNNKPYAVGIPEPLNTIKSISGAATLKNVFTYAVTPNVPDNPPLLNEILSRVVAKQGPETSFCMQSANSLWMLKNAIEAANSIDPTAVRDKWESMDTIDTVYGTGYLGGDQTFGLKHHAVGHPQPTQIAREDGVIRFGAIVPAPRIP